LVIQVDDTFVASWYDVDWSFSKKLTIDASQVDAALTDFQLTVDLTDVSVGFAVSLFQGTILYCGICFLMSQGNTRHRLQWNSLREVYPRRLSE